MENLVGVYGVKITLWNI